MTGSLQLISSDVTTPAGALAWAATLAKLSGIGMAVVQSGTGYTAVVSLSCIEQHPILFKGMNVLGRFGPDGSALAT